MVQNIIMPDDLEGRRFWQAQGNPSERKMADWMDFLWGESKGED